MTGSTFKRLFRLALAATCMALPVYGFLAAQAPAGPLRPPPAYGMPMLQETSTPTPTSTSVDIPATLTQIAVQTLQTALAATQTSVAATQTAAAAPSSTAIYVDQYEPNNSLQDAWTTAANAAPLCAVTLWPIGDLDFFRFVGKAGTSYEVLTHDLDPGIDTFMIVYDTAGNTIDSNDDYLSQSRASRVVFFVGVDGYYYVRLNNLSPGDPANQTYCFEVNELPATPTPSPPATGTAVAGADSCEYNGTFEQACLIGAGQTYDMNFVPVFGQGPDNDFYRLWVKPGLQYTCETLNLAAVNDTNLIIYDQNHNGLAGNDDRALGDFSSLVTVVPNYTGWLYVLVGPHAPPEYALSYLYTYSLLCSEGPIAPPTAPPAPTST
ncbi:MAG: PPC domain-containing protein, partial [Candidatus Promineifilaceae bacterium]